MLNKSARPKLKLQLQIHELSSIPLVTGLVFVKWHILHSTKGECRGKTERVPIIDHRAGWTNYVRECTFKVSVGRNGVLHERMLILEVWLEMISGRERVRIGNVTVNLSEYASIGSETRRYLLQESKMNSTAKVTIMVVHLEGMRDYTTPPLKKAQMFHGITNLLAESKDLPQISRGIEQSNSKHWLLHSPTQEMYRRTFAAQWRVQAGELPPTDVVEDIFKGGTGWKADVGTTVTKQPERRIHDRPEPDSSERMSTRDIRERMRPLSGQYTSLRYQRSQIPFNRPITLLSPDDPSDYDEDDGDDWPQQETGSNSNRFGHNRSVSIVSVTPRRRKRNKQLENVITSESWEKEELESGRRSWQTPDLQLVEEKIEVRRLAKESRSTNSGSGSAPGSSGRVSTVDRSASLSGSILNQAIVENGGNERTESKGSNNSDITD